MTREMKIGLLLSLGIVIVVFVLLSDQVVSTDVRPAPVTEAGAQVHEGIATPGGASAAMGGGPIQLDNNAAPSWPVATGQEMAPRPETPGISNVNVGPANSGMLQVAASNNVATNSRVSFDPNPTAVGTVVTPMPGNLAEMAANLRAAEAAVAAQQPRMQEYKAAAGDTVAKMARKFYGSDTNANRELIINANKAALKADPSRIILGKVYMIPVKQSSAPMAAAAPTTRPAGVPAAASGTETPTLERLYVVKSGDNLWKIAKEQCKDTSVVDEIRKMNREQLKGGADLKIGMKLKLPPAGQAQSPGRG